MADERPSPTLLALVILAAPMALAAETGLRALLFPADFELVRELLSPYLTVAAWIFAPLTALAGALGWHLQRRLSARHVAKLPPGASFAQRQGAVVGVFLLTSSVPQIPTILVTFLFMFGSALSPVLASVVLCSVAVTAQALRIGRLTRLTS